MVTLIRPPFPARMDLGQEAEERAMVTLHEADFQAEVLESERTVLVDFFATW